MLIQKQPNRWSCLPASFATVMGISFDKLITLVGHDGSEIIEKWANYVEPLRRRGFHIQEMIYIANKLGFSVTPFEPRPVFKPSEAESTFEVITGYEEQFEKVLANNKGVLTGENKNRLPHAVAWDGDRCHDPGGDIVSPNDFMIKCFWRVSFDSNTGWYT